MFSMIKNFKNLQRKLIIFKNIIIFSGIHGIIQATVFSTFLLGQFLPPWIQIQSGSNTQNWLKEIDGILCVPDELLHPLPRLVQGPLYVVRIQGPLLHLSVLVHKPEHQVIIRECPPHGAPPEKIPKIISIHMTLCACYRVADGRKLTKNNFYPLSSNAFSFLRAYLHHSSKINRRKSPRFTSFFAY
jgi:hypothetical protein